MNAQLSRRTGFTLVELLVVIAIIALLLAALLPAMSAVRTNAKKAETQSIFTGLDTGIESYRAEQSLGSSLPPSTGDNNASGQDRIKIATPPPLESTTAIKISGAHLLVLAMMGDGLGTAGFKNVPGSTNPGWWDDTHKDKSSKGLYAIDDNGKEIHPRYGPYVDEKLTARAKGLNELAEKGGIVGPGDPMSNDFIRAKLPVFLDSWDRPVLYYKSNPGSTRMLPSATAPSGIYRQEDNAIITGTVQGELGVQEEGLDFGSGKFEEYEGYHAIARAKGPEPTQIVDEMIKDTQTYPNTFARFILDQKVKSRPTPVNKDKYLLISAGPDGIYGTADDLTNWTRDSQ